MGVGSQVQPL
ncbi:hypothetical protein RDI58_031956 [Solanum bulbocastanum]|uniref:Uncharacterized protein n=1 Tax=Solanum bulbocastanum TaxID=147425 RepID=A0AAN8XUR7_SOLBU